MNVKRMIMGLVVVTVLAVAGIFIYQQFLAADSVAAATGLPRRDIYQAALRLSRD